MIMERKDHPGDKVRARHLDFIKANFELLATIAYKGYLEHGRGLVAVIEADFLNKPKGIQAEIRMTYMAAHNAVASLPCLAEDKEQKWLHEYDPDNGLVIGFLRTDGGFSSYNMKGLNQNAPKAIYERKKP